MFNEGYTPTKYSSKAIKAGDYCTWKAQGGGRTGKIKEIYLAPGMPLIPNPAHTNGVLTSWMLVEFIEDEVMYHCIICGMQDWLNAIEFKVVNPHEEYLKIAEKTRDDVLEEAATIFRVGGAIYEEQAQIAQDDEQSGTLTLHHERYRRLGLAAIRSLKSTSKIEETN